MKTNLCILIFSLLATSIRAQSQDQNYVEKITFLEGATNSSENQSTNRVISVQYYDDLGRPFLSTAGGANTSETYLHTYTEYDGLDRQQKVWSPVTSNSPSMINVTQIASISNSTYDDSRAYSQMTYDLLDRPTFVSTPGQAWTGKGKRTIYRTNTSTDAVKKFTLTNLYSPGTYAANTLDCTETQDEEEHKCYVFTDFLGRKVLERIGTGSNASDTYYVYNNENQLAYVLPPMYVASPSASNLAAYAYQYTYDDRGRVSTKKLPGCVAVSYSYDHADRVISMQDGMLAVASRYRVYEYDHLGRLRKQSISDGEAIEYDEIEYFYDDSALSNCLTSLGLSTKTVAGTALSALLLPSNGIGVQVGSLQRTSKGSYVLTSYRYDKYGRIIQQCQSGLDKRLVLTTYSYKFTGAVQQEETRYYDYKNNQYQLISRATVANTYAHNQNSGLVTNTKLSISNQATGGNEYEMNIFKPTYDNFGNVTLNDRDNMPVGYTYDILHRWLRSIECGGFSQTLYRETGANTNLWNGSISAMTWQVPGDNLMRRYDYTYDNHNRLTASRYSEQQQQGPLGGAFAPGSGIDNELLQLIPNTGLTLSDQLFAESQNADSAEGEESTASSPNSASDVSASPLNKYGENIVYDKNSNITSLSRYGRTNTGSYGLIDQLSLSYQGNQRTTTTDSKTNLAYSGSSEFVKRLAGRYSYNVNGALSKDENRGIDTIKYDLCGNPNKIIFADGSEIEYEYTAEGKKLQTKHKRGRRSGNLIFYEIPVVTTYIGNLVMKDSHPEMLQFDGGYASFDHDTIAGLHLYIRDYMGNNRMVVNRDGTIEQITHYYPYGGVIGDISTNESLQKFKFEGKELDRTFGLDSYDIEARQYFSMAPMWDRVDPLAEKYYGISPYVYCGGDPVNLTDYDGKRIHGNTKRDAKKILHDIYTVLSDEKFSSIRQMITIKGNTFNKIDDKLFDLNMSKLNLSEDESTYLSMVKTAINDDENYTVEYLSGEYLSDNGAAAVIDYFDSQGIHGISTPEGNVLSTTIESMVGGLNVPTSDGSYSFVPDNQDPKERAATSQHEVLGHGIASARKASNQENQDNAIRTENVVRRILGIQERDGKNHHTTNNPYSLPTIIQ